MSTSETQDLGSDLTLYAARLVRLLRRERRQPAGMRVLSILDEAGVLGVSQLAAVDQCSQPTMTGIVNGLVERGWVRKEPDPSDARSSKVTLTPSGHQVLADARAGNGALVAERLRAAGTGTDDLRTAVAVLRSIVDQHPDQRPDPRPDPHPDRHTDPKDPE